MHNIRTRLTAIILSATMLFLAGCERTSEHRGDASPIQGLDSIVVNDYEIHYLDIGEGDPVVFVHGGVGDYRTWEAQMDAFSENYRVIAISRRYAYPNEQVADEGNDYSVTPHSKDLTQFLKSLDLGPVHLVGHSYGGFTSLLTTLEHPELVRSLTLGEPPVMSLLQYVDDGAALGSEFVSNVLMPAAQAFQDNNDETAVDLFIGGVLDDKQYFSRAPQEQKDLMMDNAFGLRGVILTRNPFPPMDCDSVKALQTPTLLIKGDKSPRALTAIVDVLDKCIEGSELATLRDASHGLEYENPEGFNRIVLGFLSKH